MRRISYVLLALSFALVENSRAVRLESDFVKIASIPENGISQEHFMNLMALHRIAWADFTYQGVAEVTVGAADAKQAKAIVAADKIESPWHYVWPVDKGSETYKQWEASPEERKLNVEFEEYRNSDAFKNDALLRGVARQAFTSLNGLKWPKTPRVAAISLWQMPYLGGDFKLHEGVRAKVWANYPEESKPYNTLEVFAWDEGRKSWTNGAMTMHMSHPLAKQPQKKPRDH